jgi:hypothetical protein
MGASASVYWEALNDELNEEEVKMILADEFDQKQFDTLRDKKTGLLSRTTLMEIIHNHKLLAKEAEVKEIFHLFVQICGKNGEMTRSNFISFCKEAKLLSKKNFPRVEADIMFDKALKVPKVISKTMNFRDFMRVCIPLIAEKLKVEVHVVLRRLASVDHAPTEEEKEAEENALNEMTKEECAAMKIQTSSRRNTATKLHKGIVEAEKSARHAGPEFFDVPADPDHKDEKKLEDVFVTSCSPKMEMDLPCCLKLCKDSKIVNDQFFTNHDVQLVFLKAKSIAMHNEAYKTGIIVGKRLNYKVFREILIPCLAEKRTQKPPTAESRADITYLLRQVPSDNVEVETESTEALKSFFSILRSGANLGETAAMERILNAP